MSVPSRNISYKKPEEPSFLKVFKAKVGYREPAGLEAKRELPTRPEADDGEEVDRDDEQPTVVVLRQGDLGQEEYQELRKQSKLRKVDNTDGSGGVEDDVPTVMPRPGTSNHGQEDDEGGKIKFRKPIKRKSLEGSAGGGGVLDASTNKKLRTEDSKKGVSTVVMGGVTRRRRSSSGSKSNSKQVKNSSLLSFGDDEDDEET